MERPLILVVDDERDIQHILRDILQDEGYAVVCAATGRNALTCIGQRAPNLVLLDIHLVGDLSGLALLHHIRTTPATRAIPVIVISADTLFLTKHAHQLHTLRCEVLPKPFELSTLLTCVERTVTLPPLARTV